MEINWRPSPNFGPRERNIDMVVIHFTNMATAESALDRLCDPAIELSAHYLIDKQGCITQIVAESACAWHAGLSAWQGLTRLNHNSIGIELDNNGAESFPEAQIAALEWLLQQLVHRHKIPFDRILGHADVSPDRKSDPGEFFPWQRLSQKYGFGLKIPDDLPSSQEKAFASLGYNMDCFQQWVDKKGLQAAILRKEILALP